MLKTEELKLVSEWDKTFPQSEKVEHQKVTFVNRYGITLAADMYKPENITGKCPALAVCGPFGAALQKQKNLPFWPFLPVLPFLLLSSLFSYIH